MHHLYRSRGQCSGSHGTGRNSGLWCSVSGGSHPSSEREHESAKENNWAEGAAGVQLHDGLRRRYRAAGSNQSDGGRRDRWTQSVADRPSRVRKNDAVQKTSIHSTCLDCSGGARRYVYPLAKGAGTGWLVEKPAISSASSFRLDGGNDRWGQSGFAGRGLSRARRRTFS